MESIRSVMINYNSITSTLEEINEIDSYHRSDAGLLLKILQNLKFVFRLKLMKQVF